jgi:predicted metal-dependent hydrolase
MELIVPPLTVPQRQLLAKGIELFNEELFFECHEAWEEAWIAASGGQRAFLQGLIQVAAALHHLRRENLAGAGRLLAAGIQKLAAFAPQHETVDVGGLLQNLEPLRKHIESGEVPRNWKPPKIVGMPPAPPSGSEECNRG